MLKNSFNPLYNVFYAIFYFLHFCFNTIYVYMYIYTNIYIWCFHSATYIYFKHIKPINNNKYLSQRLFSTQGHAFSAKRCSLNTKATYFNMLEISMSWLGADQCNNYRLKLKNILPPALKACDLKMKTRFFTINPVMYLGIFQTIKKRGLVKIRSKSLSAHTVFH